MPITLSKRSFLKSLFIAPAIVAATNIMPVKAIEMFTKAEDNTLWLPKAPDGLIKLLHERHGSSKLITDLSEIQEASSFLHGNWQLVEIAGGERRWMSTYNTQRLKFKFDVIKSIDIPQTPRQIDTTVALMKEEPGSQVIWELSGMMMK